MTCAGNHNFSGDQFLEEVQVIFYSLHDRVSTPMEPNICIGHYRTYTDLSGKSVSPRKHKHVGHMGSTPGGWDVWDIAPNVYQLGIDDWEDWCCSHWARPPPDALWQVRGKEWTLFTRVMDTNLNFINTPLEHRHNLSIRRNDLELKILAENERHLWKGSRNTFIPFKRPHPQGYQGVLMSPSLEVGDMGHSTYVYDDFTSGHVLMTYGC